jgi:hypothetical protein
MINNKKQSPKVEVLREYEKERELSDMWYYPNKDKNFYYCWAEKKDSDISLRKYQGWEVVQEDDNPVVRGQNILMRIPLDRYNILKERLDRENKKKSGIKMLKGDKNLVGSITEN